LKSKDPVFREFFRQFAGGCGAQFPMVLTGYSDREYPALLKKISGRGPGAKTC
jgi:hypothetical protein